MTYLLEAFDFQPFVVQEHLDVPDSSGHVVYSLHQQCLGIIVNLSHAEPREIRLEGNSCVLFPFLVFGNLLFQRMSLILQSSTRRSYLWFAFLAHVVREDLLVFLASVLVCCFDDC